MNQADSERFSAFLVALGGKPDSEENSKIIIFVSCGVRQTAEQKIVSSIKKSRNGRPGSILILTGCLAHRPDVQKSLREIVDIFIPAGQLSDFVNEIKNLTGLEKDFKVDDFYTLKPLREETFRVFIPIMTGCNNFCSYCVVPYARGREVSRSPEEILEEVKLAIKNDAKEIFLLGQNVNSYKGEDGKGTSWDFPDLLKKVNSLRGDFWIKFLSSHPKDTDAKLLKTMSDCKKVSPNLHLPIQSGSNKILKLMNRKYTAEKYLNLLKKAKEIYPEIVISSDIIVGFPGESEKDFEKSIAVVKKARFEMLYSLKYSKRPQTAASKMKETVDSLEKKRRQQELDRTWKAISVKNNQKFIGKQIKFIINSTKETASGLLTLGKSFEEKTVCVTQKKSDNIKVRGDWAWAQIESVSPLGLKGKIVKK